MHVRAREKVCAQAEIKGGFKKNQKSPELSDLRGKNSKVFLHVFLRVYT
jgi:hypothetical protein